MTEAAAAPISLLARLARQPALSLLVLCFVLWLPGALTLPPLDRDESRFAQASKQMLETHDFVDIRFGSGTRYNKPVGIYWLQAAATEILGDAGHDQIWTYRVPSLIGGYLALLFTFACARVLAGAEVALAASVLLGVSVAMIAETQIATTDAMLLAATVGAEAVLLRIYVAARDAKIAPVRSWLVVAGWLSFAIGVLLKGPVIAGVLGTTALALSIWDRDWRWLKRTRPWWGLLITALVVLPWAIAIAIHTHGAFYRQSLGHDFGDKLVGGQESHGAPPGYFLALATLTFWPAILFLLPALRAAWFERASPAVRYLIAWAGGAWLMFEIVPTKLPHYILPAYPPLAILAACWAFGVLKDRPSPVGLILKVIAGFQFTIGLAAFVAMAALAPQRFGSGLIWPLVAIAGVGAATGLVGLRAFAGGRQRMAFQAAGAASIISVLLLTVGVAPQLSALWLSPRAAALVTKDRRQGDPPPIIAGYAEPSLIFLLGTDTRIAIGADAARVASQQGGLALIEDRERSGFLTNLAALDVQAFPVDDLSGFDYSRGRKMHITIYRVAGAASGRRGG
jgi:4-amino-4-deoxy-L-arabinose transferase-like glycosyltransferase